MRLLSAAVLVFTLAPAPIRAETPWVVRLQAVSFQPANKSDGAPGLPKDALSLSSKTTPAICVSYSFNAKWSAEVAIPAPAQHGVTLDGIPLGTLKQWSPTLTARWHFFSDEYFTAYLGAGLNYTTFADPRLAAPRWGSVALSDPRAGLTLQCGGEMQIAPGWVFNLDARYLQVRSDAQAGLPGGTRAYLDPLLLSAGVGLRF